VSCAGGCKNDIREWLHRPIRLPMMRRAISLWTILLLFVFVAAGTVGGIVVTNRSVYCFRCHDMKLYYQTWRVSSHKRIKCVECHAMPGVGDTIRSRISLARLVEKHTNSDAQACPIKGQVPDANCKKCHSSTHDVVVYHGLKITHKNHWDMGIGCTFCHSRVVHGPNAATKNTPTMATCFKCHDGNKASNNCGTCHETLGLRRPALFSEVWVSGHKREVAGGRESCKRCHQPTSAITATEWPCHIRRNSWRFITKRQPKASKTARYVTTSPTAPNAIKSREHTSWAGWTSTRPCFAGKARRASDATNDVSASTVTCATGHIRTIGSRSTPRKRDLLPRSAKRAINRASALAATVGKHRDLIRTSRGRAHMVVSRLSSPTVRCATTQTSA
jgi:cytochrome c nitrite reductase small subunit